MQSNIGKFIVIEGSEGAGKTLQAAALTKYLQEQGINVYHTKEPTYGPIGRVIRSDYLSGKRKADDRVLNMLYAADRLDHITNTDDGLLSKINNGITVISDRYYLSSAAYHSSFYFDDDEKSIQAMIDIMNQNTINRNLLKPDITIFIDIDPEVAWQRVNMRNEAKEIFDNIQTIKNLRICYNRSVKYLSNLGDNICRIDGDNTWEIVHEKIIDKIMPILF